MIRWATRVVAIEDGRIVHHVEMPQKAAAARRPSPVSPATVGEPLVVLEDVGKGYGDRGSRVAALTGVTCRIERGARVALVGASGSGKSTLLHLMGGLGAPSAGRVAWPGLVAGVPLRPRQIGVAFQTPSLIPSLTALENVRLPLQVANLPKDGSMDPEEALDRFGLRDLADALPDEMSGGQMQRVALARAIVGRPAVVLADEPTGQLDRATAGRALDALLDILAATDAALVVATHDPVVAGRLDQTWFMRDGCLGRVGQGTENAA